MVKAPIDVFRAQIAGGKQGFQPLDLIERGLDIRKFFL